MGYKISAVLAAGIFACALALGAVPQDAAAQACSKPKKGCVVKKDIKKNAVDSSRVKNNSLKGADVKDGSLSGKDVKNNSLTGTDIQDKSLSGAAVQDGSIEAVDLAPGAEKDTLRDLNCTTDQVARFFDGAWECVTGGGSYGFLSTSLIDGGQGIAAMDALCQGDAVADGLPSGTYRAWLSTSAFDAKEMLPPGPFYLPSGALLALSKADLVTGSILVPINVESDGNTTPSLQIKVWTGTRPDGTASGSDCNGWTVSSGLSTATPGTWPSSDGNWTENTPDFCSASFHVYCFQVQ